MGSTNVKDGPDGTVRVELVLEMEVVPFSALGTVSWDLVTPAKHKSSSSVVMTMA